MIFGAYCVDKVHNMLPRFFMIMGAYCVGNVHNILPWSYYDNGSILCKLVTQYATLVVL